MRMRNKCVQMVLVLVKLKKAKLWKEKSANNRNGIGKCSAMTGHGTTLQYATVSLDFIIK